MQEWCKCIMREHCEHECGPKRDGRCRLRAFGTGGEGSPGVAGPPGPTDAERLDSLIKRLEEEVDRLRAESGDPQLNEFAAQQAEADAERLSKLIEEHRNG